MIIVGQDARDTLTPEEFENFSKVGQWNYTYEINTEVREIERYENIIHKGIDFYGFTLVELLKGSIEYGYNNPDANLNWIVELIKWFLIFSLLVVIMYALPYIFGGIYVIYIITKRGYLKVKSLWLKSQN